MVNDLATEIKKLNAGQLAMFKREMANLPEERRKTALSSFRGIPELSDITGNAPLRMTGVAPKSANPTLPSTTTIQGQPGASLLQRGLSTAMAPLNWIDRNINKPTAAIITAPFTPGLEGGRKHGESIIDYARRQYDRWQEPVIGTLPNGYQLRPFKGLAEAAPSVAAGLLTGGAATAIKGAGLGATLLGRGASAADFLINPSFGAANVAAARAAAKGAGTVAGKVAGVAAKVTAPGAAAEAAISRVVQSVVSPVGKVASPVKSVAPDVTPFGHWSRTGGVKELDPSYRGTSGVGEETARRTAQGGKIDQGLTYVGGQGYIPERGLSSADRFYIGAIKGKLYKAVPNERFSDTVIKQLKADGYAGIDRGEGSIVAFNKQKVVEVSRKDLMDIVDLSKPEVIDPTTGAKFGGNGGSTYNFSEGKGNIVELAKNKKAYYSVSPFDNADTVRYKRVKPGDMSIRAQEQFLAQNGDLLSKPGYNYGTWFDSDTGEIEMAVSRGYTNLRKAVQDATDTNQKAIYDLKHQKEISLEDAQKMLAEQLAKQTESVLHPKGLQGAQAETIDKLTELVRSHKSYTRETIQARKPEYAQRFGNYERVLEEQRKLGKSVEAADRIAGQELTGEYTTIRPEGGVIRDAITPTNVKQLFNTIANTPFPLEIEKKKTIQALQALLNSDPLQMNQINLLERVFGSGLAKALLDKRSLGEKFLSGVLDILNAPRALLASGDLSGFLRQGGILAARHPGDAIDSFAPMIKAMVSDANADAMDAIIKSRPGMDRALRVGLSITALPDKLAVNRFVQAEEGWASGMLNKLGIVRGSNRAYTTILNDMRSRSFLGTVKSWENAGIKHIDDAIKEWTLAERANGITHTGQEIAQFAAQQKAARAVFGNKDLEELAGLINAASGRGEIPKAITDHIPTSALATMLFSPRLIMSRLQWPTKILPWVSTSPLVRKEAAKQMAAFIGEGAGLVSMLALLPGATYEIDPRSTDFGKLKVGNTRLDIWTGYAQYLRAAAQLTSGQSKAMSGTVNEKGRSETAAKFLQSKLSPATGLVMDLLRGETYNGEDIIPSTGKGALSAIGARTVPLIAQDIADAIADNGVNGGLLATPAVFGVGVATYTDAAKLTEDKVAKQKYGMSWEEVGKKYGRAEQVKLQLTNPAIMAAVKEREQAQANVNPSVYRRYSDDGKSIETTYRDAVNKASALFEIRRDGVAFKDAINQANATRRDMYSARAVRPEYTNIQKSYSTPLNPTQLQTMSPLDIARREYNNIMYDKATMYDPQTGEYLWPLAEQKQTQFEARFGADVMKYIENYSGNAWPNKPVALQQFEAAKQVLKPYWQVSDDVWSQYPPGYSNIADMVTIYERSGDPNDTRKARQLLFQNPGILAARERIAMIRRRMRQVNPEIKTAYNLYYGA